MLHMDWQYIMPLGSPVCRVHWEQQNKLHMDWVYHATEEVLEAKMLLNSLRLAPATLTYTSFNIVTHSGDTPNNIAATKPNL